MGKIIRNGVFRGVWVVVVMIMGTHASGHVGASQPYWQEPDRHSSSASIRFRRAPRASQFWGSEQAKSQTAAQSKGQPVSNAATNPAEAIAKEMLAKFDAYFFGPVVRNPLQALALERSGVSYRLSSDIGGSGKPIGITDQTSAVSSAISRRASELSGTSGMASLQLEWLANAMVVRNKDRMTLYSQRAEKVDKSLLADWTAAHRRLDVSLSDGFCFLEIIFLEALWNGPEWKQGYPQVAIQRINGLPRDWIRDSIDAIGLTGDSSMNGLIRNEPIDFGFDHSFEIIDKTLMLEAVWKGTTFDGELFDRAYSIYYKRKNAKAPSPPTPRTPRNAAVSIEFVEIKPGTFQMGCSVSLSNNCRSAGPVHSVTITKGFEIGKYEVTQAQWQAVMGTNPSASLGPSKPVESVSWDDVHEFIMALNARNDGHRYRLPTEAEWEYAARAGATDPKPNADAVNDIGWHYSNSGDQTHPVGLKRANPWGLYDMSGNVFEMVEDGFGPYSSADQTDPKGAVSKLKVHRGGSAFDLDTFFIAAVRMSGARWSVARSIGFRLVRESTR